MHSSAVFNNFIAHHLRGGAVVPLWNVAAPRLSCIALRYSILILRIIYVVVVAPPLWNSAAARPSCIIMRYSMIISAHHLRGALLKLSISCIVFSGCMTLRYSVILFTHHFRSGDAGLKIHKLNSSRESFSAMYNCEKLGFWWSWCGPDAPSFKYFEQTRLEWVLFCL